MVDRHASPAARATERASAAAVLVIARAAERYAVESGWSEPGPPERFAELGVLPGWCYPLALCDGEHEPAGTDDVPGMDRAWPIAHRAWATRPLESAGRRLDVVVLDEGPGEWPACVVAIGEELGQPQVFAAALADRDPDAVARRLLADLAARGHPGAVRPREMRAPATPDHGARERDHGQRGHRGLRSAMRRGSVMAVMTAALLFVLLPGGRPVAPQLPDSLAQALGQVAGGSDPAAPAADGAAQVNVESRVQEPVAGDDPLAGADITFAVPEGGFVELGQLVIPAIGLQTVFTSGVHPEALTRGPGHWPGTPLPGQVGNAVLSGHRTTLTAPFADLDLLVPGNHIGVTVGRGPEIVYQVLETLVVPEEEYVEVVTAQPAGTLHELTLFACNPKGLSSQRIIVRARVEPPPPDRVEQPPPVTAAVAAQ